MLRIFRNIAAPFVGGNLLILANGLMATLVGVRLLAAGTPTWGVGVVLSAYFAGLAVGCVLSERIVHRVGHIRAFAAYSGILTALTLAHALVVHPVLWFGLRATSGLAVAVLLTVTESWLNARATADSRGLILGVYMTTVHISMAVGQFALMAVDLDAALVFLAPAVLYSFALVPVALTRELQPELAPPGRLNLRELIRQAPLGATGTFVAGAVAGSLYTVGAVFARTIGLHDRYVALFMGVLLIGGMTLQFPLGRLSDRLDRRLVLALVAGGLIALGVVLASMDPRSLYAILPAIAGVSALAFMLYPLALAHINDMLNPEQILPASGLALLLYFAGATVGPIGATVSMSLFGPRGFHAFLAIVTVPLLLHLIGRVAVRPPVPDLQRESYVPITLPSAAPAASDLHPSAVLRDRDEGP